jgi:GH15 family glucan-1,4-alpha-glucosidase
MTTIDDQALSVEPRAQPPVHRPLAGYLPIAEHGVVGDLHSAALVGTDGTIDWYCPERFDAPAVFAAILDRHRGGFYRIAPACADPQPKQLYLPNTNVLVTRFLAPDGVGEVHDFMPIDAGPSGSCDASSPSAARCGLGWSSSPALTTRATRTR